MQVCLEYTSFLAKRGALLTDDFAGIGWLAVEVNPILFELIGLGMPR